MTLAGRVTDLVTALASALNARNAPGASDYQVWLAQGNTGTIDNYRASIIGADMDFAARFQAALGTTPQATTATEVRAGITQLATLAEAQAGNTAKALSPGNFKGLVMATSLADLNAKAKVLPEGWVISLAPQNFGTTYGNLFRSLWSVLGGLARPIIPLLADKAATLAYLNSQVGGNGTNGSVILEAGITKALLQRPNSIVWDEWFYIGATTGFLQWTGTTTDFSLSNGANNRAQNATQVTLRGEFVDVHLAITSTNAIPQYSQVMSVGSTIRPTPGDSFVAGAVIPSGGQWSNLGFYMSASQYGLYLLTGQVPAGADSLADGSYRRSIPTV